MQRTGPLILLVMAMVFTMTLPVEARETKYDKQPRSNSYQQDERPVKPSPQRYDSDQRPVKPSPQRYDSDQRPVKPSPQRYDKHDGYRQKEPRVKRETRPDKQRYIRPTRSKSQIRHDQVYRKRWVKYRKHRHHHHYPTYYYHTYYLAPIAYYFYPIGFALDILPVGYVRIYIGGVPYYYYGGVYYRYVDDDYIVVRAPHGAKVEELPDGFIVFTLDGVTYYYVNNTYYIWDDTDNLYVVVKKPRGADDAIASETSGRLYVYPNKGQSEDKQAKDRYACHRWAVKQTGLDPIESEQPLSGKDNSSYKRAISACLEGRGYTVK